MKNVFLFKISRKIALILVFFLIFTVDFALAQDFTEDIVYPVDNWQIVRDGGEFGYLREENVYHLGADIPEKAGTNIYAFMAGKVKHVGIHSRFGTVVLIEHMLKNGEKIVSLSGHLRNTDITIQEDQNVSKGQLIGHVGASGPENGYWGEHLHFAIRKGTYINTHTKWVYWGLGDQEELPNWYDPALLLGEGKSEIVDLEQKSKIITVPGLGGNTQTKLFDKFGNKIENSDIYASSYNFDGGGDVTFGRTDNNDEIEELIVGGGKGDVPYIKIYNKNNKELIREFLAYDKNFKGGVRVTTGDINGDNIDEIITGAGPGGGAHIRVFNNLGNIIYGKLFPFGENLKTGVDVAAGDVDEDGLDEIIAGLGPGSEPKVSIIDQDGKTKINEFLAYDKNFKGGVRVTTADVSSNQEKDEIVTGAGPGGGPHVRVFEISGRPRPIDYFPFSRNFRGGVDVSSSDLDEDGKDEIIMTQNSKGQAWIKAYHYNVDKTVYLSFLAYQSYFEGGVSAAGLR